MCLEIAVFSSCHPRFLRLFRTYGTVTKTGIQQWNILCRWALCISLRQPTPPTLIDAPADSNVEMTWQTFGGEAHELFLAVLKERCVRDGLGCSDEVVGKQFRLHLHRGLSYLATPHAIRSIADLVKNAIASEDGSRGEK
ncbi:DNA sulfur modification protein DndE [Gemmata sp. G18]|uniref:DNA sulfur modification protein DndE n=1 Tax=Gemmata palustris TaxID=2822762 RepID=A0ABS5BMK1_9BACT|nr:DNA sulfur modification protein DndE [Gemmata palustris]